MKKIFVVAFLHILSVDIVSAQRPDPPRFHTNSQTNPAHTVTFDCSNPATYHNDTDGSHQCGYTNQNVIPTGGPPTATGGGGYSGTANNYDCYYYHVNPTAAAFYNALTDTATVPTNCKSYTGAPINTGLIFLISRPSKSHFQFLRQKDFTNKRVQDIDEFPTVNCPCTPEVHDSFKVHGGGS